MKLSIVIPVYNEKNTIEELLKRVIAADTLDFEKELIVVDDKSKDGTVEVLMNLQVIYPIIKFFFKETNSGKGATLREGFKYATGDFVIVQDADLEYDPSDYALLLHNLGSDKTVVYGCRFSGDYKDMSSLHYIGNKFLTFVTNLLFGVKLQDMETCYKLMPGSFVHRVKINSDRFNFEPEITAKILKSGMKIKETPIHYKGRSFSEGKKITWKDGLSALVTLVKYRFVD